MLSMRIIALLFLGGCLLPACSNTLTRLAPQPSTPEAQSSVLAMRVNHALMAAQVADYAELRITATDGDVLVEGDLASQELIDQVLAIAGKLAGVKTASYRAMARR